MFLKNINIYKILFDVRFKINKQNEDGDIVSEEFSYSDGDFLEIVLYLTNDRLLIISFALDGFIVSVEMGEKDRKNRISIFQRNFNGQMYIFPKNCINLDRKIIDYYLDYYNTNIIIDDKKSMQVMEDVYKTLKVINKRIFDEKADDLDKKGLDNINKILDRCIDQTNDILFNDSKQTKKVYEGGLTVLPPNVRPDIDTQYIIIQVTTGCKLMEQRKKPCAFCTSYLDNSYREKKENEIKEHLSILKRTYPILIEKAKCAFLSDGDPLISQNIVEYIDIIKNELPTIQYFESFASTHSILTISDEKWQTLKNKGLRTIYWGVESASNDTLKLIDKPHNKEMLLKARRKLEENEISYNIIVISGLGDILNKHKTDSSICENEHVNETCKFINESSCSGVFISKLQIPKESNLHKKVIEEEIYPLSELEMDDQYRNMIKKIDKFVKGSYGNQFVVERV